MEIEMLQESLLLLTGFHISYQVTLSFSGESSSTVVNPEVKALTAIGFDKSLYGEDFSLSYTDCT
jgi:hypothetical protein